MPVRRFGQTVPLAAIAFALAGCASAFDNLTTSQLKLDNPFKTESNALAQPTRVSRGPVAATDLVGPDGRCFEAPPAAAEPSAAPAPAAPSAVPSEPASAPAPIGRSNQALYFTAGPQAGGPSPNAAPPEVRTGARGIALEMSECEVVRIAGPTPNTQISANERGERVVTMTYMTGERPGIYHFVNGRLKTMERVAEPQVAAKPKGKQKSAKARQ